MTKQEALKINEIYKQLDSANSTIRTQNETIKKLETQVTMLTLATNVDEVLNRLDKALSKKKE